MTLLFFDNTTILVAVASPKYTALVSVLAVLSMLIVFWFRVKMKDEHNRRRVLEWRYSDRKSARFFRGLLVVLTLMTIGYMILSALIRLRIF